MLSTLLGAQKIALHVASANGLGDLSCGNKCAQALERMGVPASQIVIETEDTDTMKLFRPINSEKYSISEIALQVVVPMGYSFQATMPMVQNRLPTLGLYEFGFKNHPLPSQLKSMCRTFSLGLGKEDIGVFIDPAWEKKHADSRLPSSIRLRSLSTLSPQSRHRILGTSSIEKFADNSLLFTGYGGNGKEFISYMLAKHRTMHPDKDFVFVFPSDSEIELDTLAEKFRFGKLIADGEETKISSNATALKYVHSRLPFEDFSRLSSASEQMTLLTGDQSVVEGIENNKCFSYLQLDHKKNFAAQLDTLYKLPLSFPKSLFPWQLEEIAARTTHFSSINEQICRNYDCSARLRKEICSMLTESKNSPLVFLNDSKSFSPEVVTEIGKPFVLNSTQIGSLEIDTDEGKSSLPELQGMAFATAGLGDGNYFVTRAT